MPPKKNCNLRKTPVAAGMNWVEVQLPKTPLEGLLSSRAPPGVFHISFKLLSSSKTYLKEIWKTPGEALEDNRPFRCVLGSNSSTPSIAAACGVLAACRDVDSKTLDFTLRLQKQQLDVLFVRFGGFKVAGDSDENIAMGKAAVQSSTMNDLGGADNAVDGNRNGNFFNGSCTHTRPSAPLFWRVDFGQTSIVGRLVIYNRQDCCSERLRNLIIEVSNDADFADGTESLCAVFAGPPSEDPLLLHCEPPVVGRYLQVRKSGQLNEPMTLCEVEVYCS